MAKRFDVSVKLTGDSKGAVGAARRTEGAFKKLGGFLKSSFIPLIAGGLGFGALIKLIKNVTSAASAQEDAVRSLDAALMSLGPNAAGVSKRLQEQASALQRVTTAGDETIIQGQALIASFTKNEEEIKKATVAALDLSAAMGVDLNAAFLLMGKAAAGETSTLSRYGVILDKGIPKTEKFAKALKLINDQWGGRAQEQAKTFSGSVEQISDAFGDLKEKVGESLTKNEEVLGQMQRLKEVLLDEGTVDAVASMSQSIVEMSTAMTKLGAVALAVGGDPMAGLTQKAIEQTGVFERANAAVSKWWQNLKTNASTELSNFIALIKHADPSVAALSDGLQSAAEGADALGNGLNNVGNKTEQAINNFNTATEAALGLGKALGEVTSIELAIQIDKINEALLESKEKLGENSAEYIRLEQLAAEKLESLQARIVNLRDGLGDLKTATKESGDEWTNYASNVDLASAATQRFTAASAAAAASASSMAGGGMATGTLTQAEQRRSGMTGSSMPVTIGGGTFGGPAAAGAVSPDLYLIGVRPQPGAPFGVYADGRVRGGGYLTA